MPDPKVDTLLEVAKAKSFTKAAENLTLTQSAVSHHISQLEQQFGVHIFELANGRVKLTEQVKIVVKHAHRIKALRARLVSDYEKKLTHLHIGITHTVESNMVTEVLAKYTNENDGVVITIATNTIKKLYAMLDDYALDMAIMEDRPAVGGLNSLLLDTDSVVCVVSSRDSLAKHSMITLEALKKRK